MPFSTDANWPQGLLNIFNIGRNRNAPLESRYYGLYDRLFNYAIVEGSFTFLLAPHSSPDENFSLDPVIFLVVLNQEQELLPVLFAEIKDDRWVNNPEKRQKADAQMRHRFNQLLPNCPIPRLYGLSLLGTSLRVYCGDKAAGNVTPRF